MRRIFILIFITVFCSTFQLLAQDERSNLSQNGFEAGLKSSTSNYAATVIGVYLSKYWSDKQKFSSSASFELNKYTYKAELGGRWHFKQQGKSLFIGSSLIFINEDQQTCEFCEVRQTTAYINLNFDIGYSFVISDKLSLQPYFQISPFKYLYLETEGTVGPTWNSRVGHQEVPFSLGIQAGWRF